MKKMIWILIMMTFCLGLPVNVSAEKVSNYYMAAFVKTFEESKYNGEMKEAVVYVAIEIDNTIYKGIERNVNHTVQAFKKLNKSFALKGWRSIDYFIKNDIVGQLFIVFEPRNRKVVLFSDIVIKDFEKKRIKLRNESRDNYFQRIVEETNKRFRERYRLK